MGFAACLLIDGSGIFDSNRFGSIGKKSNLDCERVEEYEEEDCSYSCSYSLAIAIANCKLPIAIAVSIGRVF